LHQGSTVIDDHPTTLSIFMLVLGCLLLGTEAYILQKKSEEHLKTPHPKLLL
jgi:hypothetical protein